MVENSDTKLEIKYHNLNKIIEFSTISHIRPPEKALKTFVAELTTALNVVKELRELSQQTGLPIERQEVGELLYKVVQITADYYFPIRTYSIKCAEIHMEALKNPDMVSEDAQTKILFEEKVGPFVRELAHPISALQGYMEIISKYPLSDDKKQEMLTTFDKIIGQVLDMLALCKKYLDRGINLPELRKQIY